MVLGGFRRGVRALALGACFVATSSQGATFVVDRTDDSAAFTDCNSMVAIDCSLRGAIIAAELSPGPDIVQLPAGTFNLTVEGDGGAESGDLDLAGALTIEGVGAESTLIDAGYLHRVFQIETFADVTVSGLTIRRGDAASGGGVYNSGNLDLIDVIVEENRVEFEGGGIFAASSGSLSVIDSIVRSNVGVDNLIDGAGIYATAPSDVEVIRTLVIDNGLDNNVVSGGGIYAGSPLTIEDSTISGNYAMFGGGVFATWALGIEIRGSTFSGNLADEGGAIYAENRVTLLASTISHNTATSTGHGAGIWTETFDPFLIANSTIVGNEVAGGGGAGGGLYVEDGLVDIVHSTFAENNAFSGPQIYNFGSIDIANSVVVGVGTSAPCSNTDAPLDSLGGNVESAEDFEFGGNSANTCDFDQPSDQVYQDDDELELDALANNGGPTETRALLAGSVAIGAGVAEHCEAMDQRGYSRVGATCDSGAFEVDGAPPEIFADGFESGDTASWSATTP